MGLWQRGSKRLGSFKGFVSLFLVGLSLSVAIAACSSNGSNTASAPGGAGAAKKEVELQLVSFAVTKSAHDKIIPKFVEKWQKEHNQTVVFKPSYGGSGSQTRAVIDGLEADVVHLALGLDVQKIEKAGLIEAGWDKEAPNDAIASRSVAAIVTREGNPKGIKDWTDLGKDGVSFITADPKTSGGARWNFLALWNAAVKSGADDAKAQEFITKAYKNVPVLPKDAREASDIFFKQGQGDALINYENEILLAAENGEKLPYIIPAVNVSIDNPVAVVDKNVDKHGTREVAEAFVQYLFSPEAQQEFANVGFRLSDLNSAQTKSLESKYPQVKDLATVKDYGGWGDIQTKFFADGAVFDQIQAKR
ncbi:MAG TPA: sulfate ABC transporter substrate-binding protein [Candidatus Obscuribacterales bacterium]